MSALTSVVPSPTAVVVAYYCPFPTTHGNRRRLLRLLSWLRNRGFKTVLVLQPVDVDDPELLPKLADIVDHHVVVDRPRRRTVRARLASLRHPRRLAGALVRRDRDMDDFCWPTTLAAVEEVVRAHHPLVVLSEYAFFSKAFERLPSHVLKVIDTVEVFQRTASERERAGFQSSYTADSETRALSRADVLLAIQPNDAEFLKSVAPRQTVITALQPADVRSRVRNIRRDTVLYVGSSNPFNRQGLSEFLAHAWPAILRAHPPATLHVVGAVGSDFEGRDRVVLRGYVGDAELAEMYAGAHVVINPQLIGTGLKIKCVEALAQGCPLVVNEAGADGLESGRDRAFLVAKDWSAFAAHVLRLLVDEDRRLEQEREAWEFARRWLSEDTVFAEFGRLLDDRRAGLCAT